LGSPSAHLVVNMGRPTTCAAPRPESASVRYSRGRDVCQRVLWTMEALERAEQIEQSQMATGAVQQVLQLRTARQTAEAHRVKEAKRLAKARQCVQMSFSAASLALGCGRSQWDEYFVLGLTRDFSPEELKRAFRQQSLKMHPDKPGGSEAAFRRVAGANDILGQTETRHAYDIGKDLNKKREAHEQHEHQTVEEEIIERYFAERFDFEPFGNNYKQIKQQHYEEMQRQKQHTKPDL